MGKCLSDYERNVYSGSPPEQISGSLYDMWQRALRAAIEEVRRHGCIHTNWSPNSHFGQTCAEAIAAQLEKML